MEFTAVQYKPLGPLAAMTDIATGELTLNSEIWPDLPDHWKRYILLHEQGHLFNGNRDELAADLYARKMFIDRSSPAAMVRTINQYNDLFRHYQQAPAWLRQQVSDSLAKVPGYKNQAPLAFLIPIAIGVFTLGREVYKGWKRTNDYKKAEKSARIAGENSAALQLFTAEQAQRQWILYAGAGVLVTAIILWLFAR